MTDLNYVRDLSEIGVAAANVRRDQAPHGFWHCCVVPLAFRAPPGPAAACARGRRPAREPSAPRASLGVVDLEARPGPAAAHGHRSQALRPRHRPPALRPGPPVPPAPRQVPPAPSTPAAFTLQGVAWRVDSLSGQASSPSTLGPHPISHVIPSQVLQIMNWRRCNCNVCGRSPKVTVGNYVRLLFSPGPAAAL